MAYRRRSSYTIPSPSPTPIREATFKRLDFDSIGAIYDYIKDTPEGNRSRTTGYDRDQWAGGSWGQAVNWLNCGWPEGVKEIDVKTDYLMQTETVNEAYRWDVTGDLFDVAEFLTGTPECWLEPTETEKPKKSIRIAVNIGANCTISTEEIYNRGAVISALIDKLYRTHYIDLIIYKKSANVPYSNVDYCMVAINVDTRNFYSRDILAYLISNAAFFRRILFATMEKLNGRERLGDYGHSEDSGEFDRPGTVHFKHVTSGDPNFSNLEASKAYFDRLLEKIKKKGGE